MYAKKKIEKGSESQKKLKSTKSQWQSNEVEDEVEQVEDEEGEKEEEEEEKIGVNFVQHPIHVFPSFFYD